MSDTGGEDNPAFANDDDCGSPSAGSALENSRTESLQQEQLRSGVTVESDYKSPVDALPTENGGPKKSFVAQHYVEPVRSGSEPQSPNYKTETRIELPAESNEKNGPTSGVKVNGVNGNGNNNDASFLNTSVTSVQTNGKEKLRYEFQLASIRVLDAGLRARMIDRSFVGLYRGDPSWENIFSPDGESSRRAGQDRLFCRCFARHEK